MPCSKIKLSIRAMIMNSLVFRACFPWRILWQKFSMLSCCCSTSVPKREFRFKPILSSMITADTPMRSRVRTV